MIVLCGIKFLNGHCADLHTYKYSGGVVCMCECICRWGRHKTYRRTERQHWGRAVAVNLMPTRRFLAQQTQRLFSPALPTRLFSLCVSLPWCAQYPVGYWNVLKRVFWRCTNFAWRTSHWVCVYICIYSHIYIFMYYFLSWNYNKPFLYCAVNSLGRTVTVSSFLSNNG